MRSIHYSLAFALFLTCPAFASAQLRFVQSTANLGELRGGPIYQHRFDFVNDFAQPIEITDFRLGCGCLQPTLDKRIYRPGEKGMLAVSLRTLGQPNGPRTWQAHVQYRAGDKAHEAALVLGATIRNEVTVEPSILAMTVETTLRQEVIIKDQRDKPMQVIAVRASSSAVRVTTEPMAGGVTKVLLEVSGTALTSARQEETLNIYTDDPLYRHLQVPITLMRAQRANVSATPAMVEISGTGSQLVRLRGTGDQLVRIEKVAADHVDVKCTWAPGPGNDATLKVSLATGQPFVATVRVQLREPPGAVVTIPVVVRKE